MSCTNAPRQTPVKEVQVQSSDPVAQSYAIEEVKIGSAQALSEGLVIEELGPGSSDGTLLGETANREAIYLAQFQNKLVLVNYWSSKCDPCWRRMLEAQQIYEDYETYGLVVANVNFGEDPKSAKAYMDAKGRRMTMMQLTDPSGQAASGNGVANLPTTVLFDRNGREVVRYGAGSNADKIRQDLDLLLK